MPPLSVGLVGAGMMARIHLSAWLELGARVGVHSDDGRAGEMTGDPAHAEAVSTLAELLSRYEIIDICTPTFTHKDLILAAVEAGRHVICEKPLARTAAEARRVVKAAEAANVRLLPAHVVRFFPAYAAMADAVRSGEIGEPAVLRFTRAGAYPVWSPWFADPALSGGILVDQMIHDFDLARLAAGEVTQVHAQARGVLQPPAPPGSVAAATAVLTHASGAISHVHGEWGVPGTPFRTTFRIAGAQGLLEHDSVVASTFRVAAQPRDGAGIPGPDGLAESPYLIELREFAQVITGASPSRVTAADGLAAVRIAAAAAESAATGRAITLAGEGER
ncbi:MAG TPA: Gfo/Idh/MocA family oxidoreductase [Trebonia sp.]|jgi:myo-inositol 2-dehydrogenase/D-chiro-inositol 1-dehydrogenase